jgi:hypothetical protein
LNIANASEIIPANARYSFHPPECSNASQNLITPAGPVNLLSDVFILHLSNETKSFPNVPNVEKVSAVCAWISFAAIPIDLISGNWIGLSSIFAA